MDCAKRAFADIEAWVNQELDEVYGLASGRIRRIVCIVGCTPSRRSDSSEDPMKHAPDKYDIAALVAMIIAGYIFAAWYAFGAAMPWPFN